MSAKWRVTQLSSSPLTVRQEMDIWEKLYFGEYRMDNEHLPQPVHKMLQSLYLACCARYTQAVDTDQREK